MDYQGLTIRIEPQDIRRISENLRKLEQNRMRDKKSADSPEADDESLSDMIRKAADKHLKAEPSLVGFDDFQKESVSYSSLRQILRYQTAFFLYDVMKSAAKDEMAATPDGVKAIAEVATALERCLH